MAYDPASGYIYMTRSYTVATRLNGPYETATCNPSNVPVGVLPDRLQLYRVANGVNGALGQGGAQWDLLVDLGCMPPSNSQPYQAPLNVCPDSATIRHDGKGNVKWSGTSLVLEVGNGSHVSCTTSDLFNVYELTLSP
jgi:hypothetical protein